MSLWITSLVQSHTASIHSTDFEWYLLTGQELLRAWGRQEWTHTGGRTTPPSLPCSEVWAGKSRPGN